MINKKKCSIGLITAILLLSFVSSTFTVQADSPRTVYGIVYIDGETAPDGTTVKLSFTDQEFTNETFIEGDYVMTFLEDNYEEGTFLVYYQGVWYPTVPPTVELGDQHEIIYHVDLYVTLPPPPNNPPDAPFNPTPENNEENVSLNPTLSVTVTDPDEDPMLVSFYNASDDTLIDYVEDVPSGSEAAINWNELEYNTTYCWYTVANDGEFDTQSDTWCFTTEEGPENEPPTVEITKPEKALYLFNNKIRNFLFRKALIIGKITIEAEATDDKGVEKVEFYINGKLMGNDTSDPYTYNWTWSRPRLFHIFRIKVIAYDYEGATAQDSMNVKKFL